MGRIGDLRDLRGRWLRWRWGSVATVAAIALVLGWVGFDEHLDRTGEPHNVLDSLYRALGLFTFEGGDIDGRVPWEIQVARFMAPLTVFAAAVGATLAVFHREVQRLKAHWFVRDHVVVIGLNARALRLARKLIATGHRCVITDVLDSGTRSTGARLLGIPVVTTHEHDIELVEVPDLLDLLARSGVHRAEAVVVMTGSPELNARFAFVLHNLLDDERAPRRVFVEMDDVDSLRTATGHSPRMTRGEKGNLEWFSLADRSARSLLDKLDQLLAVRSRPARRHLVVVGRTAVGRSLVVQAARNWSRDLGRLADSLDAPGDAPPPDDPDIGPNPDTNPDPDDAGAEDPGEIESLVLTLVEPSTAAGNADVPLDHEAYLLNRRDPRVPIGKSDLVELVVTPWEVTKGGLDHLLITPPSAVIVTGDTDAELLRLSLDLSTTLPREVPVWLCAEQSGGLADIVSGRDVRSPVRPVHVFHAVDSVLREDGILRGIDEELARAVHQAHCRYRNAGATSPDDLSTIMPWDDLSLELRSLNHEAVGAWRRVLVGAGYRFVPFGRVGADTAILPADLVEQLAFAMHEAWNAEKKRQGYRPGVRRNDDPDQGALTHPDIDVPFANQPLEEREWSLVQARLIPEHLAAAGLQLDPLPPLAGSFALAAAGGRAADDVEPPDHDQAGHSAGNGDQTAHGHTDHHVEEQRTP